MQFLLLENTRYFFISNTFISNTRLKLAKKQVNAKQHPEAEFLLFAKYSHSSSTYCPKIKGHIQKNKQKNKCVCFHEIIIMIMKMELKKKNGSHRYDVNRPTSRDGHKYSKYKKCRIKQHLSDIWSSIHEKVKQHCGSVEKSVL